MFEVITPYSGVVVFFFLFVQHYSPFLSQSATCVKPSTVLLFILKKKRRSHPPIWSNCHVLIALISAVCVLRVSFYQYYWVGGKMRRFELTSLATWYKLASLKKQKGGEKSAVFFLVVVVICCYTMQIVILISTVLCKNKKPKRLMSRKRKATPQLKSVQTLNPLHTWRKIMHKAAR